MIIYGGGKGRIYRNVQPLPDEAKPKAGKAKVCRVCGLTLPLTAFSKVRTAKDGRHTICMNCASERERKRYRERKETK